MFRASEPETLYRDQLHVIPGSFGSAGASATAGISGVKLPRVFEQYEACPTIIYGSRFSRDPQSSTPLVLRSADPRTPLDVVVRKIQRYACAFLNGQGGTLIVGVTGSGAAIGFSLVRQQRDKLRLMVDAAISHIAPMVEPRRYTFHMFNVVTPAERPDLVSTAPPSPSSPPPPPAPASGDAAPADRQRVLVVFTVHSGNLAPVYFTSGDRRAALVLGADGHPRLLSRTDVMARFAAPEGGRTALQHDVQPSLFGLDRLCHDLDVYAAPPPAAAPVATVISLFGLPGSGKSAMVCRLVSKFKAQFGGCVRYITYGDDTLCEDSVHSSCISHTIRRFLDHEFRSSPVAPPLPLAPTPPLESLTPPTSTHEHRVSASASAAAPAPAPAHALPELLAAYNSVFRGNYSILVIENVPVSHSSDIISLVPAWERVLVIITSRKRLRLLRDHLAPARYLQIHIPTPPKGAIIDHASHVFPAAPAPAAARAAAAAAYLPGVLAAIRARVTDDADLDAEVGLISAVPVVPRLQSLGCSLGALVEAASSYQRNLLAHLTVFSSDFPLSPAAVVCDEPELKLAKELSEMRNCGLIEYSLSSKTFSLPAPVAAVARELALESRSITTKAILNGRVAFVGYYCRLADLLARALTTARGVLRRDPAAGPWAVGLAAAAEALRAAGAPVPTKCTPEDIVRMTLAEWDTTSGHVENALRLAVRLGETHQSLVIAEAIAGAFPERVSEQGRRLASRVSGKRIEEKEKITQSTTSS